nr:unnamed protein product [Digitaria exilis]
MSPSTALKNGSSIATSVVNMMRMVRSTSLSGATATVAGGEDGVDDRRHGTRTEDVPGCIVAKGSIPGAPKQEVEDGGHAEAIEGRALHGLVLSRRRAERVLDLDEHVGEGVGEGDVAEREEDVERLLFGRVDGGAGERAADLAVMGRPFGGAEAEADEGIAEGGGHGDDGEPGDVVEAWEL